MVLSTKLQALQPSATIAMTQKARDLREQGKDIISLSIGEPDFNTPEFIKEAAKQAIDQNYSHYSPIGGFPELKEAIVRKFKRDNHIEYKPSQIVVSTGAKQAIFNSFQCLLNPGDEVLIPIPYWVTYSDIIRLSGGIPVLVQTTIENDYKVKIDQLESRVSNRTKAIIFSSPCNPSGSVYNSDELKQIALFAQKHDLMIISDEIYEHILYTQKPISIASLPEAYDRTITINGLSKAFAMTGWRIGYMGAPEWISKACETLQGQVTSGTNSIAQRAAITALDSDLSAVKEMVAAFEKRKNLMMELASEIPGFRVKEPRGAFYLFPDVSGCLNKAYKGHQIQNSDELAMYLLKEAHVSVVSGSAFGMDQCIRISFAASENQLKEAMKRIKNALQC